MVRVGLRVVGLEHRLAVVREVAQPVHHRLAVGVVEPACRRGAASARAGGAGRGRWARRAACSRRSRRARASPGGPPPSGSPCRMRRMRGGHRPSGRRARRCRGGWPGRSSRSSGRTPGRTIRAEELEVGFMRRARRGPRAALTVGFGHEPQDSCPTSASRLVAIRRRLPTLPASVSLPSVVHRRTPQRRQVQPAESARRAPCVDRRADRRGDPGPGRGQDHLEWIEAPLRGDRHRRPRPGRRPSAQGAHRGPDPTWPCRAAT